MNSIQLRLVVLLAVTLTVLSAVAGGALYVSLRHAIVREFDAAVDGRRTTFQSLITERDDGTYDVDIHPETRSARSRESTHDSFSIVDAGGRTVAEAGRPVPDRAGRPQEVLYDADFADGTAARVVWAEFRPHREADERITPDLAATPLTIVFARDRGPLDRVLLRVGVSIAVAVAGLSLAAVVASAWIVRGGLGGLRRLAAEAGAIDVARPDARFATAGLSTELRPIATRLNDMLGRVGQTMARERRFTSDVAHELRTPIAELRSAAEVALRNPHDGPLTVSAVEQARDIALQMQTVVSVLLSIVRQDGRDGSVVLRPVPLRPIVDRAVARLGGGVSTVDSRVAPDVIVLTDAALLDAVLANLLGNANDYGLGVIRIGATVTDGAAELWVENEHAGFTADDVTCMFEPFWRKDAARSDGRHVGLGLTLVRSYCDVLDATVSASLEKSDCVRVSVWLPTTREAGITVGEFARGAE